MWVGLRDMLYAALQTLSISTMVNTVLCSTQSLLLLILQFLALFILFIALLYRRCSNLVFSSSYQAVEKTVILVCGARIIYLPAIQEIYALSILRSPPTILCLFIYRHAIHIPLSPSSTLLVAIWKTPLSYWILIIHNHVFNQICKSRQHCLYQQSPIEYYTQSQFYTFSVQIV